MVQGGRIELGASNAISGTKASKWYALELVSPGVMFRTDICGPLEPFLGVPWRVHEYDKVDSRGTWRELLHF